MKNFLKKLSKSPFFQVILAEIFYAYLKFVSITSEKIFEFEDNFSLENFIHSKKTIFTLWHQNLVLCVVGLMKYSTKFSPLVSPHSDGMILARIISKLKCNVIHGSTNKNSFGAIKEIYSCLKLDKNILITPDGPRGPAKKINSNIVQITTKTNSKILILDFEIDRSFQLNSWDKLKIPLPFSKIRIKFKPIKSEDLNKINLEKFLG